MVDVTEAEHDKLAKPIIITPYNNSWPDNFATRAENLMQLLGDSCLSVHHIGSTSVPGLSAKPTLDIVCVVRQLADSLTLCQHGYKYKGELNIPLRYYFSNNAVEPHVNLHVVEKEHDFLPLNICFRDYLRNNKEAKYKYEKLKTNLARNKDVGQQLQGRFTQYNLAKDDFIKEILLAAGWNGFCLNFCMHNNEVAQYRQLMQEEPFYMDNGKFYSLVMYKGVEIIAAALISTESNKLEITKSVVNAEGPMKLEYEKEFLLRLNKWMQSLCNGAP